MKYKLASKLILTIIIYSLFSSIIFAADTTVISNFAGTGDMDYKDGKSLEAKFDQPYGLALYTDGGIIVVDTYNNRIRKVKDGNVTTIAGFSDTKDDNGYPSGGFGDGDSGKAKFNHPRSAVVDSKGNIYISDTGNNVIRKISNGKVYTFSGSNKGAGYADGTGADAKFSTPSGMAIDKDDNIYIADSLNHVIRKITSKGVVSTFAGKNLGNGNYKNGALSFATFNEPSDVKIDKNGVIYVLDCGNQVVRKVDKDQVSTYAGFIDLNSFNMGYSLGGFVDGKSSKARFNFPKAMTIAEDGTIFISDTYNHRIRAISINGRVSTIAGTGIPGKVDDPLPQTMFNGPTGILYNSGTLYISDTWNNCIREMKIDLKKLPDINNRSLLLEGIKFSPKSTVPQVWFNKAEIKFKDVMPYMVDGKTYLPLRAVFEMWGAKVNSLKSGQIEVKKGSFYKLFTFNNDPIILKSGRTMIDTKSLVEITGFNLEIVPNYNAIVIVA